MYHAGVLSFAHLSARPRRRSRKGSQPSSCPLAAERASGVAIKLKGQVGQGQVG